MALHGELVVVVVWDNIMLPCEHSIMYVTYSDLADNKCIKLGKQILEEKLRQ